MGSKPGWWENFRYQMDNMISKGTGVIVLWLGLISLAIILAATLLIVVFNISPPGEASPPFFEAFWQSLMRTLDPGSMADDAGWLYRLVMFGVTLGGIFVISTFIGVLTTQIDQRLDSLRRGRSKVIEIGHTVILGWNEQVFTIIEELVNANANQPDGCIVIMGPGDKVTMEESIREKVDDTRNTKVVVRTGNPIEVSALRIVSLDTAKAIIVLSPEGEDADSEVIKTCMAITKNPERKSGGYHIVAELRDPKNLEVAEVVGGDEIVWLLTGDIIAKVIAQTCRQSGLSVVYTDLLDFSGDEIYFFQHASLAGRLYGEVLHLFEKNAVMGISQAGHKPTLNPPMDTVLQQEDQLFLLALDDDQVVMDGQPKGAIQEAFIVDRSPAENRAEHFLLLGWNWRAPRILEELDHYVAPGSDLHIVCNRDLVEAPCQPGQNQNLEVSFEKGDTTLRSVLDALQIPDYDHVILLCYSDQLPVQVADAHTLITLLHLRDIDSKAGGSHFSITSEMLDIRNRNLAEVTRADDFIVSDKLISLMFSQIAEQRGLSDVFKDIFDPEGSEIYLKPAENYIALGERVNFYTVIESARRKGETIIGYRKHALRMDAAQQYGVVLNPHKSDLVTFEGADRFVVISKD